MQPMIVRRSPREICVLHARRFDLLADVVELFVGDVWAGDDDHG